MRWQVLLIRRKPILNGYSVTKIQYLQNRAEIDIQDFKKLCLMHQITFGFHIFSCRQPHRTAITTLPYTSLATKQETSPGLLPMRVSQATARTQTHTHCFSKVVLRYILHQIPPQPTWFTKKTLNKCPQIIYTLSTRRSRIYCKIKLHERSYTYFH